MTKRLFALAMAACMTAGLLAGCKSSDGGSANTSGASGSGDGDATASNDSEESVELKMLMISMGLNLEDADKVEAAINEYIEPLVHATLDIEWLDMGDYMNQLNLKLTSGETIDILPTFGSMTSMWYAQDALMPITDLIQNYGQGIIDAVGEDYMKAGYINGELYAIPCIQSFAQNRSILYKKDIAEQYNIDMSQVKTLSDLTDIFAQLHEADPNLTLLVSNNPNDPMLTDWDWDGLGDEYGVLMGRADTQEVVNLFETDEYKELVTLMHEWYQAGYVQTDASTTTENMGTLLSASNAFATIGKTRPGVIEEESATCGYQLEAVQLVDPLATTSTVNNAVLTIPSTSAHPEKAMEVLNLLYTDSTFTNLLYYGIEGEHYQVVDEANGKIDYVDGQDVTTCKYVNKLTIGNSLIGYLEATDSDTLHSDIKAFNEAAATSKALGFSYDSSSVSNQLAALETVAAKYRRGLECGSLDPETELPKFIEELKNAGIEDVISVKQEQLDNWANSAE